VSLIIERIVQDGPTFNPTALVLVPTREMAIQVHETIFQLSSRGTVASVLGVYEGKPITSQIGPLKHGVDIVVGTPGRILEHVKLKTLRIEQLKMLVLNQTDEMLDLGLVKEIETIVRETPKTRQTLLFSSTASPRILSLARKHLREPELIGIEPDEYDSIPVPETPDTDSVNLYFGVGKCAGVTPRDLVGAITNDGGLSGEQIGEIKIKQNFSLVAVPTEEAEGLLRKLRTSLIKGRKTKIRLERFQSKDKRSGGDSPGSST